jgi:hypothetical protein
MSAKRILGSLLIILSLVTVSCGSSNEPPKDIVSEDTYINLLVELQLAEAFRNQYNDTTQTKRLVDSVLTVYGVGYDRFLRSHRYYQSQLDKQEQRYEKAVDRLSKLKDQVNPHKKKSSDS